MKPTIYLLAVTAFIYSCSSSETSEEKKKQEANTYKYPVTECGDVSEDYQSTMIDYHYRWLEFYKADNVKAWLKEQNKVTFDYLEKIHAIKDFKKLL
jgi:prolyl oligopeptidase